MICADTSSMVALLGGETGGDVQLVSQVLTDGDLVLSNVTVTELLSDPDLPASVESSILTIPRLEISPGYWERAGKLRSKAVRNRYRPKIADTLIAQSCLDHDVPLITRDQDFKAFQKLAGLRLL